MRDPMLGETQPMPTIKQKKPGKRTSLLGETLPLPSTKKRLAGETSLFGETLPLAAIKKKRKLTKKELAIRIGILCMLLFMMTYGIIFGVLQYQHVKVGVQHLHNAETLLTALEKNPFNTQTIQKAQLEFGAASQAFQQINVNFLPGVSLIGSAQRLLPIAREGAQAGVLACQTLNLLAPILKDPMNAKGPKLTQADLTTTSQNVKQIQILLNLIVNQINQLQPSDLQIDPSLEKVVGTLRKDGPTLLDAVNQVQSFLTAAPALLGVSGPANYLLEIMDSTELRPGGGFIGNYGTLTLSSGHVSKIFMTDIDLLDKPFFNAGERIPYPPQYSWFYNVESPASWWLENSNLDASFPIDAQDSEQNYTKEATWQKNAVPLQGTIAITPWFMEGLLKITGPINMQPAYPDVVTSQNLISEIHLHQLGTDHGGNVPSTDGHSSQRKRFTSYLADDLIARVHQMMSSPTALSEVIKQATSSFKSGDIQIYFNPPAAESILQHYQLSGAVLSPPGDGIYVVDANIAANKANLLIKYTLNDQVTIDTSGNAVHHATLTYAWVLPGSPYGKLTYQEYAQVYVPSGSTLQSQSGWQPRGQSQIYNRDVWQGFFDKLTAGQTQVITLTWTTPKAAQFDGQVWHYRELIQKQPGDTWTDTVQVTLPKCAAIKSTSGGLVAKAGQSPSFSGSLIENKNLEVDYTCK